MISPRLIEFPVINGEKKGSLSFCQNQHLPFEVKRVYWIYDFDEETIRGGHAHIKDEQVLICLHGRTELSVINQREQRFDFVLDNAHAGVFVPKMMWRETKLFPGTVLMSLASSLYNPNDYIRDFNDFLKA